MQTCRSAVVQAHTQPVVLPLHSSVVQRSRSRRRYMSTHARAQHTELNGPLQTNTEPTPQRRALLLSLVALQCNLHTGSAEAAQTQQPITCLDTVSGVVCVALLESLAECVQRSQETNGGMAGVDFTAELEILQKRELKYAALPEGVLRPSQADLRIDDRGTTKKIYDLVSYWSWKVIAAHVKDTGEQARLCRQFALAYLSRIWPDALQDGSSSTPLPEAQVYASVATLLDRLQQSGYLCRFQIIWDETPGTWPQTWMEKIDSGEPIEEGRPPSQSSAAPQGLGFQIKIYLPADLEGSIALRSEEEAFWPNTVPTMISLLLEAGGYAQASADTYFYQDRWQGPKSWKDQLLLQLGDPLEQVGIDFTPTTLVMDWTISPPQPAT